MSPTRVLILRANGQLARHATDAFVQRTDELDGAELSASGGQG